MDKELIASMLPTAIRPEVLRAALDANFESELGGNPLVYWREAWNNEDWGPMGEYYHATRRTWGARCLCHACGAEFWAGWVTPKNSLSANAARKRGIALFRGEDNTLYSGVPENADDFEVAQFYDGEKLNCPECLAPVTVWHKSKLRGYEGADLIYRVMAGSVENVGKYTAIVFWALTRRLSATRHADHAGTQVKAAPGYAALIDTDDPDAPKISLFRFDHKSGGWRVSGSGAADPCQIKYQSREAINREKIGVWFDAAHIPDQRGQSGEKAGLAEYLEGGGRWPVMYLRFWTEYPTVENLIKSGWLGPVESAIDHEIMFTLSRDSKLNFPSQAADLADWRYARPRDMLSLTKQEARDGAGWGWKHEELYTWMEFVTNHYASPGDAASMNVYYHAYGVERMREYLMGLIDGEIFEPFCEIDRYLQKQQSKAYFLYLRDGLRMFLDYRRMLYDFHADAGTVPAPDELWPRRLPDAHDRLAAAQTARGIAGFDKILKKWGALEYSDGELCAKLPEREADLIREGSKLHHCVGSYGKSHVSGRIIIFIRHARRPERNWYTLNEDLTGDTPRRVQLHGYRNERLKNGKSLRIPKRVLDFVARWEREILTPVFAEVRAAEREKRQRVRA